jgi:hypothetical protein
VTLADALLERFLAFIETHRAGIPSRFVPERNSFARRGALPPNHLECLRSLDRVQANAEGEARPLAAFLRRESSAFHWGQTYRPADFGEAFLRNYGWLEVFGSRGCFAHDQIAGGLLLLGRETLYPDHHHIAEEIYVPLTGGSEWREGENPFELRAAGEIIHHASDVSHAMRTGPEPLLAAYLWRGGPLDQRSEIGVSS